MFQSLRKWPVALLAAPVALCLGSGLARAEPFDAPLVQCKSAALTTCAEVQDPLKRGGATINDQGDVTVIVVGAATNTTYAVSLVSNDGTQTTSIGNLKTGADGNGAFRKDAFFKFGTVGAGNVVLTGGGGGEFVTGLSISSNGLESARDFQPALVRCTDVTAPGTLSGCGSDSLTYGHVDVENDDGALSIHVSGARPSTSYTAILRSPGGMTTALGTVGPTNGAGNATLVVTSEFPASMIGSGAVVLQSAGTDEFVSGFKVDQKFVRPKVSGSSLEPCGSVTDPILSNCGSDPLDDGSYDVNAAGDVSVKLSGANPGTNYELFFRPLDDSADVDTGVAIPTNALGNADTGPKSFSAFTKNTIASGTFVVKHPANVDTLDQFVAGYEIH
ncbi:MAG TPA: hypothetical protein VJX68_10175 [Candidatus Binatus sp.]|uniref:hypothetical protein n=1 Tax=Candidatus Binatus sp. TaxID=2811406 RepID=UPI002B495FC4|nr:hypothetical protein [Candidatus Binatus sp.]HKN13546.1 hypothetical protein [Candidatus Binatus sp.]